MQQLFLFKQRLKPRYGGHEGYLPKKHWLKRVVTAAVRDPHFWCDPQPGLWGLTPAMLKSARHWAIALKLLEPQGGGQYYNVSTLARALLLDDGADPYLEEPQSQWLLHWQLLKAPCYLKTWQWFFNQFYWTEFTPTDALQQYVEYVRQSGDTVAESTLAADLKCLYRLYGDSSEGHLEDQLTALFSDLTLFSEGPINHNEQRQLHKRIAPKDVSPQVLLYACLEYAQQQDSKTQRIALKDLLYTPNSPGLVFWKPQYQLEGALDVLCAQFPWLHVSTSADITALVWDQPTAGCLQSVWQALFHLCAR